MVRTAGGIQAVSMLMDGRPLMTDQSRHFQHEPYMQKQTALIQIHLQNNQLQNKTNYKTKTITNKTNYNTQTITKHNQLQTAHTQANPSTNQTKPAQSIQHFHQPQLKLNFIKHDWSNPNNYSIAIQCSILDLFRCM